MDDIFLLREQPTNYLLHWIISTQVSQSIYFTYCSLFYTSFGGSKFSLDLICLLFGSYKNKYCMQFVTLFHQILQ